MVAVLLLLAPLLPSTSGTGVPFEQRFHFDGNVAAMVTLALTQESWVALSWNYTSDGIDRDDATLQVVENLASGRVYWVGYVGLSAHTAEVAVNAAGIAEDVPASSLLFDITSGQGAGMGILLSAGPWRVTLMGGSSLAVLSTDYVLQSQDPDTQAEWTFTRDVFFVNARSLTSGASLHARSLAAGTGVAAGEFDFTTLPAVSYGVYRYLDGDLVDTHNASLDGTALPDQWQLLALARGAHAFQVEQATLGRYPGAFYFLAAAFQP
jgi:hypothetical protein